ncbi:MAG: aminotransferase class V-fold PLP-dependent enzyme [Oscillospiraceae bacterium]|nr:aminotransferase class V-fold PLP-dependent enzyme [Oscillospiraceae bacterium]
MIYFDSAATTMQKPERVTQAMVRAMHTMASPGRGSHHAAALAAEAAFACREEAAGLFGLDDPSQVVFTFNATHALNIAIKSLVRAGDTVVISGYEHNAVTRPLHAIGDVEIRVADGPLFCPRDMIERFDRLITPEVSCVVCTHMSNVFGYILPIDEIAELCERKKVPLIVDASQSAGSVPIDMRRWRAAFVAMPGHKGLYGPQGTGLLLCNASTRTLLEGGTGSASALQRMPDFLPDRLEAGTHNIPGIAGLLEGLRFVRRYGVERIGRHEVELSGWMADKLMRIPGIQVFEQGSGETCRGGVLSFVAEGNDCEELGQRLGRKEIAVRSGLHCAPLAHRSAGTLDTGTIRISVSAFNTLREARQFVAAIKQILF